MCPILSSVIYGSVSSGSRETQPVGVMVITQTRGPQRTDSDGRHDFLESTLRLDAFVTRCGRRNALPSGEILMNKNQLKGRKDEMKGKVKEADGRCSAIRPWSARGRQENMVARHKPPSAISNTTSRRAKNELYGH